MGQVQARLRLELEEHDYYPGRRACVDGLSSGVRGFSFLELDHFAQLAARGLQELCGVAKGDVVAVHSPNLPEWAILLHAVGLLGAVLTPVSLNLTTNELEYQIRHSRPKVLITVPSLSCKLRDILQKCASDGGGPGKTQAEPGPEACHLYVFGSCPDARPFGSLLQNEGMAFTEDDEIDIYEGSEAALYMYTPIGAGELEQEIVTHADLLDVVRNAKVGQEGAGSKGEDATAASEQKKDSDGQEHQQAEVAEMVLAPGRDVVLATVPFDRLEGLVGLLLRAAFHGCTTVTVDLPDLHNIPPICTACRVTVLPLMGSAVRVLGASPMDPMQREVGADQANTVRRLVIVGQQADDLQWHVERLCSYWGLGKAPGFATQHVMFLTELGAVVDESEIRYPETQDEKPYVQPFFFRAQTEAPERVPAGTPVSKESPLDVMHVKQSIVAPDGQTSNDALRDSLQVTADVTFMSASADGASRAELETVLRSSSALQVQSRAHGSMGLEIQGPWSAFSSAIFECHTRAHARGGMAVQTMISILTRMDSKAASELESQRATQTLPGAMITVETGQTAAALAARDHEFSRGEPTSPISISQGHARSKSWSDVPMTAGELESLRRQTRSIEMAVGEEQKRIRQERARLKALKSQLHAAKVTANGLSQANDRLYQQKLDADEELNVEQKRRKFRQSHSPSDSGLQGISARRQRALSHEHLRRPSIGSNSERDDGRASWAPGDAEREAWGPGDDRPREVLSPTLSPIPPTPLRTDDAAQDVPAFDDLGQDSHRGLSPVDNESLDMDRREKDAEDRLARFASKVSGERKIMDSPSGELHVDSKVASSKLDDGGRNGDGAGESPSTEAESKHGAAESEPLPDAAGGYTMSIDDPMMDYDDALKLELEDDMKRLLEQGVKCFNESNYERAKKMLEEVIRIAQDLGNRTVEGRAMGNLASVYEASGEHHKAIEMYMGCQKVLSEVGETVKLCMIFYNISHSFLSLGRYTESIDYLNRSLALASDDATRETIEEQLAVVQQAMLDVTNDDFSDVDDEDDDGGNVFAF